MPKDVDPTPGSPPAVTGRDDAGREVAGRDDASQGDAGPGGSRRGDRLTRGLGWASAGLGVPQLLGPREVAKAIGIAASPRHATAVALVGARELAAAAGLLRRPAPAWLWARVGGDAMDMALLGRALRTGNRPGMARTAAATAAVAGITAVDLYAAATRSRKGSVATAATTVGKPPQEVYEFWRRLENLPTFMAHLEEVRVTGERTSSWRATAPLGRSVEWDAEITEDVPGERIAWRSVAGADVENEGSVRFLPAPGDRGTEVHVTLRYAMPGGPFGAAVARYFGEDPHQQVDDDLRRLKQVLETGEVTRSDGAPGGKRARHEFPQRPAQPMPSDEVAKELRA